MQKMLNVKNLKYNLPTKDILENVSFKMNTGDRLALFGENGAGKSTLLKILIGEITDFEGEILKEGHTRFFYATQEFPEKYWDKTIFEYILEFATVRNLKKVFDMGRDLGYDLETNQNKKTGELSGGQQKILQLSVALSVSPDYLLLDEPENHIDIVSRQVLIEKLQEFRGGIIFVSHDRFLIDNVSTIVGELYDGKLHISLGGYDEYLENKLARIAGMQREYDKDMKKMQVLRKTLVLLKLAEFDGLKEKHKDFSVDEKATSIKIGLEKEGLHNGKLLLRIIDGEFSYGENETLKTIFKKTSIELRSGKRVVLLGRNGVGKSTFIKCLLGHETLSKGVLTVGEKIKIAYFNQHAEFEPGETALQLLAKKLDLPDELAKAALGNIKFDTDRMKTKVENLSGGERMRLRFAITFGLKPDLLILDEPTNHIDEVTWEILLQSTKDFKGTILLITHDHEFIQEFQPNYFWMFQKQVVVERHKFLEDLLEELKVA
jgi:ATPase subunit of ABC transporter with duplicated ATPase domains